jgi:hypothetical protein
MNMKKTDLRFTFICFGRKLLPGSCTRCNKSRADDHRRFSGYQSEFEKVYKKNNNKEGAYDMKDVREYLELYINYKLKVKEAEEEKLDTSVTFVNELRGYPQTIGSALHDRQGSD